MSKKTILYIHQSSDLYGSDKMLLHLIKKLDKKLFTPIVVIPRKGLLLDELEKHNIKVIVTPVLNIHKKMFNLKELLGLPFKLVKSIIKLNKELKGIKIDIIQSNTVVVTLGFIYSRLKGIQHFWHIHEVVDQPKLAASIFPRLVNRYSDLTIFNSKATKESFCKKKPSISSKSIVIYNGLNRDSELTPENEVHLRKQKLQLNKKDIVIGLVGRINKNKGHLILLEAFKLIADEIDNVKLLFVGSSVKGQEILSENLRLEIENVNLSDKVQIISYQKNIWEIWDIIDIAVVPSTIKESFGLVALEAMLSKKPVIASDLGALKEVVEDNVTGFLFKPASVLDLKNKISKLIDDKDLRREFGKNGEKRALDLFALEKYVTQFENIYR